MPATKIVQAEMIASGLPSDQITWFVVVTWDPRRRQAAPSDGELHGRQSSHPRRPRRARCGAGARNADRAGCAAGVIVRRVAAADPERHRAAAAGGRPGTGWRASVDPGAVSPPSPPSSPSQQGLVAGAWLLLVGRTLDPEAGASPPPSPPLLGVQATRPGKLR